MKIKELGSFAEAWLSLTINAALAETIPDERLAKMKNGERWFITEDTNTVYFTHLEDGVRYLRQAMSYLLTGKEESVLRHVNIHMNEHKEGVIEFYRGAYALMQSEKRYICEKHKGIAFYV